MMKLRKTTATLLIAIFMISTLALAVPTFAKHDKVMDGRGPQELTISFYETAIRTRPDGSPWYGPTEPELYIVDFVKTGNAYHKVGHGVPGMDYVEVSPYIWFHTLLPDLEGSPVVIANGKMRAVVKYTSLASFLPIEEHFKGTLVIDDAGTMSGEYTQDSYAFGSEEAVLDAYPKSVPTDEEGKWYIGHTVYTATAFSPLGDWVFDFFYQGNHWCHDMMITTLNLDGSFSGTGGYPEDGPYSHPWTVTGAVSGITVDFTIVYDAPLNYAIVATGMITPPSMGGDALGGGSQIATWTTTRP